MQGSQIPGLALELLTVSSSIGEELIGVLSLPSEEGNGGGDIICSLIRWLADRIGPPIGFVYKRGARGINIFVFFGGDAIALY
jgi:hypothetical protein